MKSKILIFNMPDKKRRLTLEMILFPIGVSVRYVKKSEYNLTLESLYNSDETTTPFTGNELSFEMLVFCNVDDKKLSTILAGIRKSSLKSIPYKAVLTDTNKTWLPTALFNELKREREAIKKQMEER